MAIMAVAHPQVLQHPQPHLQVNQLLLALMLMGCQIYIKLSPLFHRTPMERLLMVWMRIVCNNQIAASMCKATVSPSHPNRPLDLPALRPRTFLVSAICLMTSRSTMVQTIRRIAHLIALNNLRNNFVLRMPTHNLMYDYIQTMESMALHHLLG